VQASPFLDMLVNASQQKLSLTPADLSKLVEAAMANPHFVNSVRAMILNNYGAYLFNVVHDRQTAISLTLAAATQEPRNPYFQLNLAQMALTLGQRDEASQHLAAAERLDITGIYDRQISDLKSRLASESH
jgi:predicted Zn-dependent protease